MSVAGPRRSPASLSAFVLHQYDWSESSLIVDLFTREQGRLVVVAKGAKRPFSQLRAVLMPFNRIQVSVGRAPRASGDSATEGSNEVQTLRAAEWAGGPATPAGAHLFSAFYLNELLIKLLARHDPHPGLFDVYAATLPALAAADPGRPMAREPGPGVARLAGDEGRGQGALRAFELRLLQAIGLLPDLSLVTATLAAVEPDQRYRLTADHGVSTSARPTDAELPGSALIDVQAALQHGSLAALQQACQKSLPAWRTALRGMLQYHLGNTSLRTRQLMIDLQAFER